MMVEGLIAKALADGASDIHLVRGLSPRYRVDGSIREMDPVPLAEEDCSALARELAGADFRKADVVGEADLAVTIAGVRCRVNLFRQQGAWSAAIRLLKETIPELEQLGRSLPPITRAWCSSPGRPAPENPPPWRPSWSGLTSGSKSTSSPWRTPLNTSTPPKAASSTKGRWAGIPGALPPGCGPPSGRTRT